MQSATTHIDVWDPYFNLDTRKADPQILSTIPPEITLRILTQKGIESTSTYLTDVHMALRMVIPAVRETIFGLRVMNKKDMGLKNWMMHDRFLIIDRTEVHLVGSSMGYHYYPEMSTGIYKVEKQETADFIRSVFDSYWSKASGNQIPMQSLHIPI